ncbi:MAG: hypothetical protein WAV73_03600 [Candidatus Moraniibacteriota bacterium]
MANGTAVAGGPDMGAPTAPGGPDLGTPAVQAVPGTERSQLTGVVLVAVLIVLGLLILGGAYIMWVGSKETPQKNDSESIATKSDITQALEPVVPQLRQEVPQQGSNTLLPAQPPVSVNLPAVPAVAAIPEIPQQGSNTLPSPQPSNQITVPAEAAMASIPAVGTLQQTINIYCGGKPCEQPVEEKPKAVKKSWAKKHSKPAASVSAPAARVVSPACPDGNCSPFAWNPAEPHQPAPGMVSPRQF